jgi:hypothetical protein
MKIFTSKVRSAGDLAGVFEYDGGTGYFYLYDQWREPGKKVLDAIQILSTAADFEERDVQVLWNSNETCVGLVIRDQVWAAFDTRTQAKYGGDYRRTAVSPVLEEIVKAFDPSMIRRNGQ